MTSAISAPKMYVTITPGPASRMVTVLPSSSPTPIALPIAIMAIWRGTSFRFSPSSVATSIAASRGYSSVRGPRSTTGYHLVDHDGLLERPAPSRLEAGIRPPAPERDDDRD